MSTAVILPALAPDVERKEVAGGLLLRHPRHGTQLLIPQEERPAVEAMDGSRSLELLEQLLAPTRGTLGYQSLVMLLFRLWDRGLLSNEDEVRQALFRKKRTLDRARSRTKWLQALVSFSILGEWVAGAFRWLGFLGRPLLSLPMLDVLASLTVVAGVFLVMGVTPWPEHLFRHEGSWLAGIVVFYGGLAGALSLRGLARAAALEGAGTGLTRAGIRVIAGIIHFDVDDTAVFHLPRATQVRFAALGLLVPGGLAGVLLQVEALVAGPWDRLGAAALLALFANLCPFLQTDGARLAEQAPPRRDGTYQADPTHAKVITVDV